MSCARAACPGLDPASPSGAVLVAFMLSRAPSGGKFRRPEVSVGRRPGPRRRWTHWLVFYCAS